jgi:hypothetical protein
MTTNALKYNISTITTPLLLPLDPFPPAPFPKKGRGSQVLIYHMAVNNGIRPIRTHLPSLVGEGLGVGYN